MSLAADRRLVGPGPATGTAPPALGDARVRPLSLRLNVSWILAGNLARAVCRYGVLLLFVHFCGLAAAGQYAIAVALCTPIWAMVMLGLRGAQVTDACDEFTFGDYLALRLVASALGMIVVAAIVLVGGYDMQAAAVISLVAVSKLIEGISDIFWGRLQQRERMDRTSIALVVQGVGQLALVSILGGLGGGTVLVVASIPAAAMATLIFWDIPCYRQTLGMNPAEAEGGLGVWREPIRWRVLTRLTIVSLPLAVAAALIALIPQLPKYVIIAILGNEAVAVYTLITYWITLGMMIVVALGNAAAPRLAKYHAAGQSRAFCRLLLRLVALVAGMGIAGVAIVAYLGPQIAAGLGRQDSDLPRLAVTLSVFAAMLYITGPLGRALGAMRKFWSQTVTMAAGIAVALSILPWCVRAHGLSGAAEAMALSMAVVALLSVVLVWRELAGGAGPATASTKEPVGRTV
ncbi:MAG: lipopolysaccharide biosynthesis protein [Thermoguttaceae bacterium]